MSPSRLELAFGAIDAANADDPVTVVVDGVVRSKEQAHAEGAVAWVRRLRPDASEVLLLAARAHHVRRWEIPRTAEAEGRAGYLRWKRRLQRHHAEVAGAILAEVGYDEDVVGGVQAVIRKEGLRSDPEVRTLEDALALIFVETQLADLAGRLAEDHVVEVVAKTLAKMSAEGRAAALALPVDGEVASLLQRAAAAYGTGRVEVTDRHPTTDGDTT